MDEYKVAIVIPAFNEENTIAEVIQSVTEYGYVIVVNDASSDRTMQIAKDVGATVVNHQVNQLKLGLFFQNLRYKMLFQAHI